MNWTRSWLGQSLPIYFFRSQFYSCICYSLSLLTFPWSIFPLDQRLVFTSITSIDLKQTNSSIHIYSSILCGIRVCCTKTWDIQCVAMLITGPVIWWDSKHKSDRATWINPVCACGCTEWRLIWPNRVTPLEEEAVQLKCKRTRWPSGIWLSMVE